MIEITTSNPTQVLWRVFAAVKWWHILAVFTITTLYWITPAYREIPARQIKSIGGYRLEGVEKSLSGKHGPVQNDPTEFEVAINPLVTGVIQIDISWNEKGETYVSDERINTAVRPENVILLWGLCLGAIIALASAKPGRQTVPKNKITLEAGSRPIVAPSGQQLATAEQTLADDVAAAANRASDVYRRSTFLLAGGILMAFVGVSVFAVTLPPQSDLESLASRLSYEDYQIRQVAGHVTDDRLRQNMDSVLRQDTNERRRRDDDMLRQDTELLQGIDAFLQGSKQLNDQHQNPYPTLIGRAMRPFGMLIFVEGIAWFLLRQYRSLIEDYKTFVRIQLKRSNYLIAFRAALTAQAGTPAADVIRMLLSEDLSGRLSQDQTTEALETLKYQDEGPILESMKELKDLIKSKVPGLT